MTRTADGWKPAPGSWPSIGLIYLFGVLSSATLSKIIPVLADVSTHLGATRGQHAWLISLVAVLPALLASVAGSIIDRIGAHRALQLVALIGVAINAAYLLASSLPGFMLIRVFEGLIAAGAYSAAPALIMATTSDARRRSAMAVWSTYTPVGFSLGLVLGGVFAGSAHWRGAYLVHLLLFAMLLAMSWLLPRPPTLGAMRPAGSLFSAYRQRGPVRLALAFALLVLMGFGMSSVYPDWYAGIHQVTVGQASRILGYINLVMIPAGFMAGALLARGWRDARLLSALLAGVIAVSLPVFHPATAEAWRQAAMVLWMLTQGALIAVVTSALPRVVADPRQGAAAAGLLSQLAALVTFVTPLIWQPLLQAGWWPGFAVVTLVTAALCWLVFPRGSA